MTTVATCPQCGEQLRQVIQDAEHDGDAENVYECANGHVVEADQLHKIQT